MPLVVQQSLDLQALVFESFWHGREIILPLDLTQPHIRWKSQKGIASIFLSNYIKSLSILVCQFLELQLCLVLYEGHLIHQ